MKLSKVMKLQASMQRQQGMKHAEHYEKNVLQLQQRKRPLITAVDTTLTRDFRNTDFAWMFINTLRVPGQKFCPFVINYGKTNSPFRTFKGNSIRFSFQ